MYLLDTDICSYIMKRTHPRLITRIRGVPLAKRAMLVVTLAELLFGAAHNPASRAAVDDFVRNLEVLELTTAVAEHYADIRAALERAGRLIGANALFIAAHARALNATLVTNNVREFGRVAGLRCENWTT